ncbi:response regulator [Pseudobacteriovorax antillogorgiicola]|uniref:Response regulator receiver domain-containing protein n=1 Tax=Pseudobacteriovorax antillogorgiicola TaxID=1513793 RepID=A0A1Y6CIE4_9BACT|nr:response regulator [Pseudobacteriovorax antillogorgiicola]TCS48246.1 response regulator receiver domain-containing protein [Pseudobacteriovorax antillogorgiicola]SMF57264.1 Response regulator receiver domain-containing protein [Pseudobacteriovorax antillogorgiicola]
MKNILIVDDSPEVIELLEDDLSSVSDVLIEKASHGKEAMDLIESKTFDLVITDYKMPEMDGFEFLQCLRKNHAGVSVIMLSGFTSAIPNMVKCDQNAVVLSKPYEPEDLLFAVENLLNMAVDSFNVLVVDPSPTVQFVLKQSLGTKDYHVTQCSTGEGAIKELSKDLKFDVIFVDNDLKDIPISDFVKQVKNMNASIKMVLMAKRQRPPAVQTVEGIHASLPKPFQQEDVTKILMNVLPSVKLKAS